MYQGFPAERISFLTGNASQQDKTRIELISQFKQAFNEDNDDGKAYSDCASKIIANLPNPLRPQFEELESHVDFDVLYAWLEQWATPADIPGEPAKTDTYSALKAHFYDARMKLPLPIEKGSHTATVLQDWLSGHCSATTKNREEFDYLTLRRGILDVVDDLKKDNTIQFSADFEPDLDKDTFLSGLLWQVRDFALSETDYEKSYLALCDYLSKPFEGYSWSGGREAKNPNSLLKEPERHLKIPLYFLRNWIAHGLIVGSGSKITAQAAGIAFLLAMQQFFKLEKYGFANELQRLFAHPIRDPQQWKQACVSVGRKLGVKKADDALKKLRKFGLKAEKNGWEKQDFIQHFYASYLLCLQQDDGSVKNAPLNAWIAGEIKK